MRLVPTLTEAEQRLAYFPTGIPSPVGDAVRSLLVLQGYKSGIAQRTASPELWRLRERSRSHFASELGVFGLKPFNF
ncbi:hypothetical protein [Nostoc sp.]